ncbi:hypothetical protein [Vibrio algarum]|uniref:Uncharacterized protein n=1 Tax=Vibrio algarum TaxID=3020714 RepID=A0ABT4YRF2_9VIBR|nr:hypothetical protein [Vibrio sp. KJ40-1]MDB1123992.1 hypothetical protein [Vibrio sp. KJ40-1]
MQYIQIKKNSTFVMLWCLPLKSLAIFFVLFSVVNTASASCLIAFRDGAVTPIVRDFAMLDTQIGGQKLSDWSAKEVFLLLGSGTGSCPGG